MKKPTLSRLLSLLLAACLLAGCGAKAQTEEAQLPTPSPAAQAELSAVPVMAEEPEKKEECSDGVHADVDYGDLHWEMTDLTAYREIADKLSAAESGEEAQELYGRLLEEYTRLRTNSELAWIDMYASGGEDSSVSEACQQLDEMVTEAGDLLYTAASAALKGPAGEALSVYVGEHMAEELADYEPMTDREAELWARETALELRYNELESRTDLGYSELNRQLGEIFLELIRVRNELAEIYEYDSYAEFAYEYVYGRDYTPEDAAALCQAVKPYARRFYANCSYCGALYEDYGRFSAGQIMDLLAEYAPRVSPEAARARQYMADHGMYLLEKYDTVTAVGFTTVLRMYNAPFLYNALYGTAYDVFGTFHEFGHYYDAFVNQEPKDVSIHGSYDVFEIHSTSMEALLYGWCGEIFGDAADYARIYCLYGLVQNVIAGCLYDEFLQYCYAHPDMTVEEVNAAYREIASSYGESFYRTVDSYYWMYVNHNFTSPFYYISYAASALASLQVWSLAEQDRSAALELYNDIVSRGAYGVEYFELMDQVGLRRFSTDLTYIMLEPYKRLEYLCKNYNRSKMAA